MAQPKGSHYPVFPQPLPERGQLDQRPAAQRGLTLLDHLAIEALPVAQQRLQIEEAGYLGHPAKVFHASYAEVATEAYNLAEAMLTERAERLKAAEAAPAA